MSKESWAAHERGLDDRNTHPEMRLGAATSYGLTHDPQHLAFVLARYKFVARMLDGYERVLEIGCGDGFGAPIVAQRVGKLHCVDWDERRSGSLSRRWSAYFKNISVATHDITKCEVENDLGPFDGVFAMDVLEHIDPDEERDLWQNISLSLQERAVCIIGTPNKDAAHLASERSKVSHINLKTMQTLKETMAPWFQYLFMFGMNDEVVHVGHPEMCHYLIGMGVGPKQGIARTPSVWAPLCQR